MITIFFNVKILLKVILKLVNKKWPPKYLQHIWRKLVKEDSIHIVQDMPQVCNSIFIIIFISSSMVEINILTFLPTFEFFSPKQIKCTIFYILMNNHVNQHLRITLHQNICNPITPNYISIISMSHSPHINSKCGHDIAHIFEETPLC